MQNPRAILVGDAHLGQVDRSVTDAFHRFLAMVPAAGDHVVIMGDLFDFWFEYGRVIPRRHVNTVAALYQARDRGVVISFIGGNHDRWGGSFFTDDLRIAFFKTGETELALAGRRAFLHHGDGLTEQHRTSKFLHFLTRQRLTVAAFRAIHPDIGYRLADWLSRRLADKTRDPAVLDRAAAAQQAWATALLERRPKLELVVLAHTHRSAHVAVGQQHYVNPGAFMDGGCYAVVTSDDVELCRFSG